MSATPRNRAHVFVRVDEVRVLDIILDTEIIGGLEAQYSDLYDIST